VNGSSISELPSDGERASHERWDCLPARRAVTRSPRRLTGTPARAWPGRT
jgi:hypothetical protein